MHYLGSNWSENGIEKVFEPIQLVRCLSSSYLQFERYCYNPQKQNILIASFQVMATSFEGFNNGREFLIVSFIPGLSKSYLPWEKDYIVPLANILKLKNI